MKARKTPWLGFLILLIGLGGCSTPGSSPTPGSNSVTILPTNAVAGSPDVKQSITGSHFAGSRHNLSQAVWSVNGIDTLLATSFSSSTRLIAVIPADLLTNPAAAEVFIQTGDPMGRQPPSEDKFCQFSSYRTFAGREADQFDLAYECRGR
jgi:hypothetical protein